MSDIKIKPPKQHKQTNPEPKQINRKDFFVQDIQTIEGTVSQI